MKKFSKCKGNTKRSWQIMKEITGKIKKKNNTFSKALKIKKELLYFADQIATEFNSFFSLHVHGIFDVFQDVINGSDLTTEEFETAFESLKFNKAAGINSINSNIVLDTYHKIKDISFLVFKTSFQQGTFFNMLKIANVTCLFK